MIGIGTVRPPTEQVPGVYRRRIGDMAAADRLLVAGMHLHFPGFGRVVREGTSFRLEPDVWSTWSDDL